MGSRALYMLPPLGGLGGHMASKKNCLKCKSTLHLLDRRKDQMQSYEAAIDNSSKTARTGLLLVLGGLGWGLFAASAI